MKPEEILSHPARALNRRSASLFQGYVSVGGLVPADILAELLATTDSFVEAAGEAQSGNVFDIGPGHSRTPVLRRIESRRSARGLLAFCRRDLGNVAADLAGPNVVYHHSKLNFKWFDETDRVRYSIRISILSAHQLQRLHYRLLLADTDMNNGPLAVMPSSHNEPLFDNAVRMVTGPACSVMTTRRHWIWTEPTT